jgi:hypothetical protein
MWTHRSRRDPASIGALANIALSVNEQRTALHEPGDRGEVQGQFDDRWFESAPGPRDPWLGGQTGRARHPGDEPVVDGRTHGTRTSQVLINEVTYPVMMSDEIDSRGRKKDPAIARLFVQWPKEAVPIVGIEEPRSVWAAVRWRTRTLQRA